MSKAVKYGIIGLLVVLAIVFVVWLLKKRNPYASADTIAKIKKGGFGSWADASDPTWGQYVQTSKSLFGEGGTGLGVEGGDNQAYASAWLRGFNLARVPQNLQTFQADIKNYISNNALRKPDWKVATGEFLNA